MPDLLVGVMSFYDWMADSSSTLGQNRDGRGWMAGPYLSARLARNLYFDARAAWGQSTTDGSRRRITSRLASGARRAAINDGEKRCWRFAPVNAGRKKPPSAVRLLHAARIAPHAFFFVGSLGCASSSLAGS